MSNFVSIGNSPTGIMFQIMPVFMGVVFLIVFGVIIYRTINFAIQKTKDKENIGAKVINKRENIRRRSTNSRSSMHTSITYYATFELEDNRRVEYTIPSNKIGLIVEGDTGTLTYQGTLFVGFTRVNEYKENKVL